MICRQCSASVQDTSSFCDSCGAPIESKKDEQDAFLGRTLLNQYIIRKKLGEGGFGAVYVADQPSMSRKIAVKTLHKHLTHNLNIVTRFRREGIAASRLIHASTVKMLNFGETEDGYLWMAMEYLEGETLDARVKRAGPMEATSFIEMIGPICEALAEAHEKGIVHRDLKPENIMLVPYPGGKSMPKLLDFGIAGLLDSNDGATKAGMIVGTPQYMSPEQWKGLQHVDLRTDIYALGLISYQALTAKLPFKADTTTGWMQRHCNEAPLDIEQALPGKVPAAVRRAVMKAIAKEPSDRYESALAYKKALEDALKPGADVDGSAQTLGTIDIKKPVDKPVDKPEDKKTSTKKPPVLPIVAGLSVIGLGVLLYSLLNPSETPTTKAPILPQIKTTTTKEVPTPKEPPPTPKTEPTPEPKQKAPSYMVRYEGGVFSMGSDDDNDQNPIIESKVAPFLLDKTEVSLAEYKGCVEAKVCAAPSELKDADEALLKLLQDGAYPVVNVTFRDAQSYCSWRSSKDGVETRLPTEAEWEFAAREGGLTKSFPWGNTWDDKAAVSGIGKSVFAPVPANEPPKVGARSDRAIHLIGNVSEWIDTKVPAALDASCASDACRVLRGGDYATIDINLMGATYRNWAPRDTFTKEIGFRCAANTASPQP